MARLDFLREWAEDLLSKEGSSIPSRVIVVGEHEAVPGPRIERAAVEFELEPADEFELVPDPVLADDETRREFVTAAVRGLVDVLMTAERYPLMRIKVRVIRMELDPIHSSEMAFRLAGRNAAQELLSQD